LKKRNSSTPAVDSRKPLSFPRLWVSSAAFGIWINTSLLVLRSDFFIQLMMSSNTRSDGTRIGLQPSEPALANEVVVTNADPLLLGDEASNNTYGNPPASKKPRIERKLHFTTLKLHTRLVIYDYVGKDIKLPALSCTSNYFRYLFLNDRNDPRSCYGHMTVMACVCGDLEALQYLHGIAENPFVPGRYEGLLHKKCNMERLCYILACNGHWKALKWAVTKQYPCENYVLKGAVMGGADVAMLEWLQSKGCQHSTTVFVAAVKRGDIDVMTWLRKMKCPMDEETFKEAALHGDLKILKWLKEEDCPWDETVFQAAAERGDIKILFWLRMEDCPWNSDTFNQAIKSGADLVTLQWFLYEDILLMDENTFEYAVRRGDLEILKWLHSKDCEMHEYDFSTAVEEGVSFDMLKWMHEVELPWDEDTFVAAVRKGDLDTLKWLHQNECPWDARCVNLALELDMLDIVKWLDEKKCPRDKKTCTLLMRKYIKSHP
jgi:hypothetical protein